LNRQGTFTWSDGRKNGKEWNIKKYNKKGKGIGKWVNGVKQQ